MAVNISKYKLQVVKETGGRYDLDDKKIKGPSDVENALYEIFRLDQEPEEVMVMLTLNNKNMITGAFEVSRGSLSSAIVHPREIYKRALLMNSARIIIAHNHPSGNPTPSKEDDNVTERLSDAGRLLGIELLDHLIVGDDIEDSYSYKASNPQYL